MILIFQRLLLEVIADILYFPIWWYTKGLAHAGSYCLQLFKDGNSRLAPVLWLENLLVPMYGQYDIQGRIVSFFMRLVQVFIRSIGLLAWFIICVWLFIVWLAVPVVVVSGLIVPFRN